MIPNYRRLAVVGVGGLAYGALCLALAALLGIPTNWRTFLLICAAILFARIADVIENVLEARWTRECKS